MTFQIFPYKSGIYFFQDIYHIVQKSYMRRRQ
jgi:hypothetical protein